MIEEGTFRLRVYSKQELAMLYFPNSTPRVAVNHLRSWIYRCKPLHTALKGGHHNKHAKFFTSTEVGLIIDYLGEP